MKTTETPRRNLLSWIRGRKSSYIKPTDQPTISANPGIVWPSNLPPRSMPFPNTTYDKAAPAQLPTFQRIYGVTPGTF